MPVIVHKNRRRGFWALVIVLFMLPISGWLLYLGLQPGRPEIGWSLVLFGALGLITFATSAVLVVQTLRSPWHLALHPSHLSLHTPAYRLDVPWEQIAGIAVDEVGRRLGCVLVFEDVPAVVRGATFTRNSRRPDAVTGPASMAARMEENYKLRGYHLGFPGRILELGPEELAGLLTRARTGSLWQPDRGVVSESG